MEPTAHDHLNEPSEGWDLETVYGGTLYVLFCCAEFRRVKLGFTRNGQRGAQRRLACARRTRSLPDLRAIGFVDLGDCIEVEGWAREEAMRLWLVHRHGFRWAAWQDWLEVPDGLDGPDVVHLVAAARDAVNAWLGIEDPENRRSL